MAPIDKINSIQYTSKIVYLMSLIVLLSTRSIDWYLRNYKKLNK